MTYLCNPLLRGRLFIDWLFYFRWLSGVDVVRWGAEKNKKINFAGLINILTFAIPNGNGVIRSGGAKRPDMFGE